MRSETVRRIDKKKVRERSGATKERTGPVVGTDSQQRPALPHGAIARAVAHLQS
jgi:hypothetical protein